MLIGLTGGIGSGKTEVSKLFEDLGVKVINADAIGKEIIRKDKKVIDSILEYFGDKVVTNKALDIHKLRTVIFNNDNDRKWLENLLHPLIKEQILQEYKKNKAIYCLLEAAILIESGFSKLVDKIVVVDCSVDSQISRVVSRNNMTEQEVKNIIKSQLSREERLKYADKIISNDGPVYDLKKKVKYIHECIIGNK